MYLTTALLTSLLPHLHFPTSLVHPHPHSPTLTPSLSPYCYSLSLSLSLSHPLLESWLEVSQQGVEGALGHSHSQEELEQLLAAAVSDEELSDSDFT